jgi:hypothetical protein
MRHGLILLAGKLSFAGIESTGAEAIAHANRALQLRER